MREPRHPNKHINEAVTRAIKLGWRVELSNGHPWGRIFCPKASQEGCLVVIYSTPRNPESHAKTVAKKIDKCTCMEDEK